MSDHGHNPALDRFNALPDAQAQALLISCCGSRRWVADMMAQRPFSTPSELISAAESAWRRLDRESWLEAFSHHPRIGERKLDQPRFAATREQSAKEQSGMAAATDAIRAEFEQLNREYEARFGHVFLICATGHSAEFMLNELRRRITLSAEQELANAGEQQLRIVELRLRRMLTS